VYAVLQNLNCRNLPAYLFPGPKIDAMAPHFYQTEPNRVQIRFLSMAHIYLTVILSFECYINTAIKF